MRFESAFAWRATSPGADRLIADGTRSRSSSRCPVSYKANGCGAVRPASTRGRAQTWFGGIYKDPTNFFAPFASRAGDVPEACTRNSRCRPTQWRRGCDDQPGRHRRARSGQALRLEDRRSHPDHRHDLAAEAVRPGSLKSSGSTTTGGRAWTRRSSFPLRLPRREPAAGRTAWSAGTSSRSPIPVRPQADGRQVRRDVRELGRRNQDRRPRRASSRASPSRSATSARS